MISAVVLAKNEEKNIEECLKGLSWCDEILVVDDNSEDETKELAKKHGAKVIERSLDGDFASQRNFGLEKASGDWVLFIDADERISPELRQEIELRIKPWSRGESEGNYELSNEGYYVVRQDEMWGRQLKHGENGNHAILRLARKRLPAGRQGVGKWTGKVHEVWEVPGSKATLSAPLFHYPHPTIGEFLSEINFYSSLRAKELFEQKKRVRWYDVILYPKAKFLQDYILYLGFLDGVPGLMSSIMMSFHSFLVRGKVWTLQQKNK